jgi:hypothetical protein
MKSRELRFITFSLILATILGGFLGSFIGAYLPEGAVKTLFERDLKIGLGDQGIVFNEQAENFKPLYLNLYSISLGFLLLIRINFVSVLAVILVIIYFKWWYI